MMIIYVLVGCKMSTLDGEPISVIGPCNASLWKMAKYKPRVHGKDRLEVIIDVIQLRLMILCMKSRALRSARQSI